MGTKENPRYNVVSLRLTDEEKAELDAMTRLVDRSVSSIMREALVQYAFRRGLVGRQA
jgi:predicted transcriptional regulator